MPVWYHATYAKRLRNIARLGLQPKKKRSLLRAAPGNVEGIYLTEYDGLPFWMSRLEEWADHDSDHPVEDGLVPVALKVFTLCKTKIDPYGSRDAMYRAVTCPHWIQPGALRVWNGKKWAKLDDEFDISQGAQWEEDEDFEEGGYFSLIDVYNSPLLPSHR